MSAKFKWFKNLYISKSIEQRFLYIAKWKFKHAKGAYCIIVPSEKEDQMLEILSGREAQNPIYNDKKFIVGGLAKNRNEAFELVQLITMDCLEKRGDLNLKEFIKCGQFF